jgi:hypothetical protein
MFHADLIENNKRFTQIFADFTAEFRGFLASKKSAEISVFYPRESARKKSSN